MFGDGALCVSVMFGMPVVGKEGGRVQCIEITMHNMYGVCAWCISGLWVDGCWSGISTSGTWR